MARMEADFRISIKSRGTGVTNKVELIRMPNCKRYWIRFNGVKSGKHPDGLNISQVTYELRKLLVGK